MEKLFDTVEKLLEEEFSLYMDLQNTLEEEKNNVVDMDIDSLWATIEKKKKIVIEIDRVEKNISLVLKKRAGELNLSHSPLKLSDFIKKLPVSNEIKSRLRKMKTGLETIKKSILARASANKKYINESLSVINDIFSLAVDTANKKQYNNYGHLLENKEKNRLINAEV